MTYVPVEFTPDSITTHDEDRSLGPSAHWSDDPTDQSTLEGQKKVR